MRFSAVRTNPVPHSKRADTFRAAVGNAPAARTRLGSPSLRNNLHFAACRNRLVRQHMAKRSPACVKHGLGHSCFLEAGRANVSDVNFRMITNNAVRSHMKKMFALIGYFSRQGARTIALVSPLKNSQFVLALSVEGWCLNLLPGGESHQRFQSEIYADGRALAGVRFNNLDLDIEVPATSRVCAELTSLGRCICGDRARKPQVVFLAENGQSVATNFNGPFEVAKRDEIKVSLYRSKAWCLREDGVSGINELTTHSVDRVGMQAKVFGRPSAQERKIEISRASNFTTGDPSVSRLSIHFATIIPNEIDCSRLRSKRSARRRLSISDPISIG
jgi:hypothetical protein